MSSLWLQTQGEWDLMSLKSPRLALHDRPGQTAVRLPTGDGAFEPGTAALVRTASGRWLLLAAADAAARVNGMPVFGMRILAHRDEIRFGRQQFYFSTERLIRPEPFAGREGTRCALCDGLIEPGMMAVQCNCGLWFHQVEGSEEFGCYLYADRCRGCEMPTSIDADLKWTPEGL